MAFDSARRDCIVHCAQMFDAQAIAGVRAHFDTVEAEKQGRVLGARDEKAHRLGTGTDSFRLDPAWYVLWRTLPAEMVETLRPFTWVVYPAQIRHIAHPHQLVPWHQDFGYQVLLGGRSHRQVITCYVSLEFDPSRAATLEFARGDFPLLPHMPQGDHGACIVDPDFGDGDVVTFPLAFGDALIFGDHAPHRTVVPPGGTIDRRSFEFRLVDSRDAIDGKDYFDLDRRCFVKTDGTQREQP